MEAVRNGQPLKPKGRGLDLVHLQTMERAEGGKRPKRRGGPAPFRPWSCALTCPYPYYPSARPDPQVRYLTLRSLKTRRFQSLSVQTFAQVLAVAVLAGMFW